ncbi:MAG: response regulator [Rhodospirillaceae bacterium]|nr:response regulator [Rhodospirillaceae bacterium]
MVDVPANLDLGAVRVLIVEDERVIRQLVGRMLASLGIKEVTEASSAEAAWQYLAGPKSKLFDIVITDLTLPGVSGIGLIENIRALPSVRAKTLPVVVLTGSGDPATYKKAEAAGISGYLVKPISVDLLRRTMYRALTVPLVPPANAGGQKGFFTGKAAG